MAAYETEIDCSASVFREVSRFGATFYVAAAFYTCNQVRSTCVSLAVRNNIFVAQRLHRYIVNSFPRFIIVEVSPGERKERRTSFFARMFRSVSWLAPLFR